MKEVLLSIGSVVDANIADTDKKCMIIGLRTINPFSMRAWDYVAVGYPEGLDRRFNTDGSFDYDNFVYFNHPDILKVIKEGDLE